MKSIRRFLTVWLLAGIGATVLVSAAVMFAIVRDRLVGDFDRVLSGRAQTLGTLLFEHEHGVELEFSDEVMPEFDRRSEPEYFEIWAEDGGLVEKSNSLLREKQDLPRRAGAPNEAVTWDLPLPDGRSGRAIGLVVPVDLAKEVERQMAVSRPAWLRGRPHMATVVVARSREGLDRAVGRLAAALAADVLASCLAILVVVALTVRRGLAPLVQLGNEVSAIDAKHLSCRVPTEGQAREVLPLSAKLNELLARLDEAFGRERRMTSNLAHELRTPIAEIRNAAEVSRKWPDDASLRDDAIETAHAVALRMGQVVESLLRLSRTEAGVAKLDLQPVDLSGVVDEAFSRARERASAKGLEVGIASGPVVVARTDAELLGIVVRNLVDNAIAHTPAGGRIESRLDNGGPDAVWTVVNAPVDLETGDLDRLAEPLWTKEASRSRRDHSGLGLALSRAIATALGATLEFGLDGRSFQAVLRVPAGA